MTSSFHAVRQLFERALDIAAGERDAWLRAQAGDDEALLTEVSRLLEIDGNSATLLDHGPAVPALEPEAGSSWLGRTIGSFKLMAVLGRGGMGTVFEAEQERPHRRVALKVMRHGLGADSARARFEYEAEILARLQHPGIAQVYEAATFDDDGTEQPYFAMELIEGAQPLDDYAHGLELSEPAMLRLFGRVCEAVHHGHQRGVVHRDLKPANVLVDSTGQPKLIDYGIARAGGTEWQATLSSESDSVVGTLAYMAPEQLDHGGAAIDTRVDVYALGVILYQLLTRKLPIELKGLPLGKATDVIRNQEPPRVSLAMRPSLLTADLDWIVKKAMAKDPDQRYASAAALREDIERLLCGEPVLAGPPSATYRLRKFVRRNRVAVIAGAMVALALIGGTIATSIGWRRALAAEALAETRRQEAQDTADEMWQVAQLQFQLLGSARGNKNIKLAEVIESWSDRLPNSPLSDRTAAAMHAAIGASYYGLGLNDQALQEYERALERIGGREAEMPRATRIVKAGHARVLGGIGHTKEAETMLREVLVLLADSDYRASYEEAVVRTTLGSLLLELRKFDEALEHFEYAIPRLDAIYGKGHFISIPARRGRGIALQGLKRDGEAAAAYAEVIALASTHLGEDDAETTAARNTYSVFLFHQGKFDEALEQFTALRARSERVAGAAHPQTARIASNQALCHERLERYPEAESIYREVLQARAQAGTPTELSDLITRFNLAVALHLQPGMDKREAAIEVLDALLVDAAEMLPDDNWRRAVFRQHRAIVLRKLERFAEAERELTVARGVLEAKLGLEDGRTLSNWRECVTLYENWGKPDEAAKWQAKLPAKQ